VDFNLILGDVKNTSVGISRLLLHILRDTVPINCFGMQHRLHCFKVHQLMLKGPNRELSKFRIESTGVYIMQNTMVVGGGRAEIEVEIKNK